jgi:hypothetical protein
MRRIKSWIIVEQVRPAEGRHKLKLVRYPRSGALASQEAAEAVKEAYAPQRGGEIVVITVSEFYAKRRRKYRAAAAANSG